MVSNLIYYRGLSQDTLSLMIRIISCDDAEPCIEVVPAGLNAMNSVLSVFVDKRLAHNRSYNNSAMCLFSVTFNFCKFLLKHRRFVSSVN